MSSVRERYGEAFWRAHHEAWLQSELNQREYCEAYGILEGDPYFYYTGTYSCKDGRIKGELVNKQHTPYRGTAQLFYAGREVGLGFSGTYEGDRAEVYGVSNVGRRSVSVHLKIRKLADA